MNFISTVHAGLGVRGIWTNVQLDLLRNAHVFSFREKTKNTHALGSRQWQIEKKQHMPTIGSLPIFDPCNLSYIELFTYTTLQGTNISPKNGILKMIFLFPRWDMLIPWRVYICLHRSLLFHGNLSPASNCHQKKHQQRRLRLTKPLPCLALPLWMLLSVLSPYRPIWRQKDGTLFFVIAIWYPPWKTNIAPFKWWFPIGISFSRGLFSGANC